MFEASLGVRLRGCEDRWIIQEWTGCQPAWGAALHECHKRIEELRNVIRYRVCPPTQVEWLDAGGDEPASQDLVSTLREEYRNMAELGSACQVLNTNLDIAGRVRASR